MQKMIASGAVVAQAQVDTPNRPISRLNSIRPAAATVAPMIHLVSFGVTLTAPVL